MSGRDELVTKAAEAIVDAALAMTDWHGRAKTYARAVLDAVAPEIEARGAERALRDAADAIESDPALRLGHNGSVVCSCLRCEVAQGAARIVRERAGRLGGSDV